MIPSANPFSPPSRLLSGASLDLCLGSISTRPANHIYNRSRGLLGCRQLGLPPSQHPDPPLRLAL
jgi:hypothetical protein